MCKITISSCDVWFSVFDELSFKKTPTSWWWLKWKCAVSLNTHLMNSFAVANRVDLHVNHFLLKCAASFLMLWNTVSVPHSCTTQCSHHCLTPTTPKTSRGEPLYQLSKSLLFVVRQWKPSVKEQSDEEGSRMCGRQVHYGQPGYI